MKTFLIIFSHGQDVQQADSITELWFKYPETVIAIITLDTYAIEEIKKL